MKVGKTDGAANTMKQMRSCSLPYWAAAGRLILGLVVWVARRGLGSGVGVKELPSECYRPQTAPHPPPACRTNSRNDPKTAFSAQSGGTQQTCCRTENTVGPINRWCQNWFSCTRRNKACADVRRPANSSARTDHLTSSAPLARLESTISVWELFCVLKVKQRGGRRKAGPAGLREGLFFFFTSMLSCSRIDRYWRPASWFQLHPLHFRPTLKKKTL